MKKLFIIICIFCFSAELSFASQFGGLDVGSMNSQYMKDLRFHEATTRAKTKNAIIKTSQEKEQQKTISNIKSVQFINNNSIDSETLNSIISDKIEKPMTPENISDIRKNIMKYYQAAGFFSAIAIVSSQDNENGELIIEINEGGKNSIQIDK